MSRSIAVVAATVFLFLQSSQTMAGPWDERWKQVDDAVSKGLPQTAIERLDPIIRGAVQNKEYPTAIKAIAKKIALEGNIQGNKPEERITRMEAEIAKAPKEMVPVLDAILADWYWQYFQQNRWRFIQRTATAAPPGKDFTTWDLPRIFAEIDKRFTKALGARSRTQGHPCCSVRRAVAEGHGSRRLAAHALRFSGPPGPGILRLGRAGGSQTGRRGGSVGREPGVRSGRGLHPVGSALGGRRFAQLQGDQAVSATSQLP